MSRLPATSTTLAGLVALATFPACSGFHHQNPPRAGFNSCQGISSPSMPRPLIGPDVNVRVVCGGTTIAPIASLDELGKGATNWSFTVAGDPAFRPSTSQALLDNASQFVVCEADSPQVAFVECVPPPDALPGATFDAIATVHADDGSFADGTVKLHGVIAAPVIIVDKKNVDFGDVAPGDDPTIPLHFMPENGALVNLFLDQPPAAADMIAGVPSYSYGPFVVTPGMIVASKTFGSVPFVWNVTFKTDVPGDYSATVGWRATPVPAACQPDASCDGPTDPSCDWTTTLTLHARVVDDGGADASDGGAGPAPDAP